MYHNDLDRQSIRNYGIHGALGLLMGAGIATVVTFFIFMILPSLGPIASSDPTYLIGFSTNLIIITVFGVYIGYIYDKRKELSGLGAIAGVMCGIAAGLSGGVLIEVYAGTGHFGTYIIVLGIAGLIFGVPEIRSMVLLAVSGLLGGTAGIGLHFFGQHLTYFLKDTGEQYQLGSIFFITVILLMLILSLLAIGIAGASISIGIYITKGTAYSKREIPPFLRILRVAGVGSIVVVLAFMSMFFVSYADYASSSASIHITSDADETVAYVPVLLDSEGNVLSMYEHPEVTGDATTEIITGEHGSVLKISGTGDVEIDMRQSRGIQRGKQLEEAFAGFGVSTANYTVGEDVRMTDVWIYSSGNVDEFSISLHLDTGWGQIQAIRTERNIGLVEGWQMVRLSVQTIFYD